MASNKDGNQSGSGGGGGGGFFSALASGFNNLGIAMSKSVNGFQIREVMPSSSLSRTETWPLPV